MKAASRKEAAQATAEDTEIPGQQQLGQRPVDEEQKKNDDDDDDIEDDDVPLIHKKRKQLEQQEAKTGALPQSKLDKMKRTRRDYNDAQASIYIGGRDGDGEREGER